MGLSDWRKKYKFIAINYQLRSWWKSPMFSMVENLIIGRWRYESQCQVCNLRAQRCKENTCIPWQLHVINVGSWLGNIKIPGTWDSPKIIKPSIPNHLGFNKCLRSSTWRTAASPCLRFQTYELRLTLFKLRLVLNLDVKLFLPSMEKQYD